MKDELASLWAELADAITDVVQAVVARVRRVPIICLISDDHNVVRTESGEPIEDVPGKLAGASCRLSIPAHWVFRAPLNPIPAESLPFLDAFARQQIDRVTPWHQSDVYVAVTHQPLPDEPSRLLPVLSVVPKTLVAPQIAILEAQRCASISICSSEGADQTEIAVSGADPRPSLRRRVSIAMALLFAFLPTLAGLCWWQAAVAQSEANQLYTQLTKGREALVQANAPAAGADLALQQAKLKRPQIVLLLEDLSAALPDTAYLTRLSIEGDRASISGVASNPPELVSVLEKTGRFSNVSFSDATTKSETGNGNHFSLEMRIGGEKAPAE